MRFRSPKTLAAFFLILIPSTGQCGMIEVRPTTLAITPSQHIAVLSLVNPEERATTYQINAFRWTQKGDEQILEATDDVIASPPIVTLAEHGNQIVRVGLRNGGLPANETTYRLILEEVPGSNIPERQGLNIALRLSFPLFVRPQNDLPPPQLGADMQLVGNKAHITVHNNGAFTARLIEASLKIPETENAETPESKRLTYIQPGNWVTYDFMLPSVPASLHSATLTVQADEGPIDLETPVVAEAASDAPTAMVH